VDTGDRKAEGLARSSTHSSTTVIRQLGLAKLFLGFPRDIATHGIPPRIVAFEEEKACAHIRKLDTFSPSGRLKHCYNVAASTDLPQGTATEATCLPERCGDSRIVEALETSVTTLYRTRQQQGFEAVLSRKKPAKPSVTPIFKARKKPD
jgi:hypothetical protein